MKHLGKSFCEKQLGELGLFSMEDAEWRCCSEVGVSLFSLYLVIEEKKIVLSGARGGLDWILGKKTFMERVVSCPVKVVGSPSLEMFMKCLDMALQDIV